MKNIKQIILSKPAARAVWLFLAITIQPVSALGLSQAQRDIFDRGILYFNSSSTSDTCDLNGGISINLPDNIPQPYNGIFSAAASAYDTNPQFLAALFLSEHANDWPDSNGPWASSKSGPTWPDGVQGARGPFQFEYGTWKGYAKDGNNDGVVDPDNIYDAAYSVANMLKMAHVSPATPLGNIDTPYVPGTFLVFTASYNWGGGNIQNYTSPTSPITGNNPEKPVPTETQNYLLNINSLISSSFTKSGVATWKDPGATTAGSSTVPTIYGCTSGVVAGNIVQTAINLSWPGPHTPALEATSAYLNAINESLPGARAASGGADCGAFVSVVMHASKSDTNYPVVGTKAQEDYVRAHPEKYDVLDNLNGPKDLVPGDILIVNQGSGGGAKGHTMIYIGAQPQGGNEASASLGDRMPSIGTITSLDDTQGRGHYLVARIKS